MNFNSPEYIISLLFVAFLYYCIPGKRRWILLLLTSIGFYYLWNPNFVILITFSILVDYFCGIKIHQAKGKKAKKKFLWASVFSNLGLLFFFKYYNFFITNCLAILGWTVEGSDLLHSWAFPIGISFYTFQTLSYTIDIYRGYRKPTKNIFLFSLYVTFFPQLLAGPIERSRFLMPQLEKSIPFEAENISSGSRLILWGLYKKMVVGDRIGVYVDNVFANPSLYNGSAIYLASSIFIIQIYCDFSGYSDIAIGSARLFGIKLSPNFHNRIYFAGSRTEFWRGWHLTLTNWFRDYLYFPLIAKSRTQFRLLAGIVVVYFLTGLWHGAAWGFIIWGVFNGMWFLLERNTLKFRKQFFTKIGIWKYDWLIYFLGAVFVLATQILSAMWFRAENFEKGVAILVNTFKSFDLREINAFPNSYDLWILLFVFLIMDAINIYLKKEDFGKKIGQLPVLVRWGLYLLLIQLIFLFGFFDNQEFYYFQF